MECNVLLLSLQLLLFCRWVRSPDEDARFREDRMLEYDADRFDAILDDVRVEVDDGIDAHLVRGWLERVVVLNFRSFD